MFKHRVRKTAFSGALTTLELIFHATVRSVRKTHNNAFMALVVNMLQAAIMVAAFYVMVSLLNLRTSALRGDFLLYIMSGIFLYMSHVKAVGAVVGAEGPSSPMMQHAPLNTAITITGAALGVLYVQVLSMLVILFVYHAAYKPITIYQPIPAFGMLLLSWFTGCAVGLVLTAIKPWFPTFVNIASTVYQRANMIASGKMFLANTLPTFLLHTFNWNPLFHTIDQSRGFVFINYNPHFSNWQYAFWVGVALSMLGLMGEFYTRRHASLSWGARR
ncbi:ABC transporter permease [Pseudooceanicola lipolyticus]|uniref:ABC transporter permease n=1 Tax=Pseudooceanicola lipolyticus TaxID=2029104 RepID=A0A2M8J3H6_9RHOB|nr:ABC transporter permease [Pseudooceanicola lipolyticus]PJE37324.1 ABC transporter permease [Pseudooceanicola lipolyticus]